MPAVFPFNAARLTPNRPARSPNHAPGAAQRDELVDVGEGHAFGVVRHENPSGRSLGRFAASRRVGASRVRVARVGCALVASVADCGGSVGVRRR